MSAETYDFSLAEDLRSIRGAIDSAIWLLNADSPLSPGMLDAVRQDVKRGRYALARLEVRLRRATPGESAP